MTNSSLVPRKSKLDAFVDIIGKEPDRVVADKAGVSPENVRTWRVRRGVLATWRGEGVSARTAAVQKPGLAPSATVARSAPSPARRLSSPAVSDSVVPSEADGERKRRPTRLEPFRHLLGVEPDRVVADRAGVSAENVRAYRVRHGIPVNWQGSRGRPSSIPSEQRRPLPPTEPESRIQQASVSSRPSPALGRTHAFRIQVEIGPAVRDWFVLGSDMADAVRRAEGQFPGSFLREVSFVGDLL